MKILKAKQVGSNFNVIIETETGEQKTLTRKKTSFENPEDFQKLKDLCAAFEASKNKETKAAQKIVSQVVKTMTPVTTEKKEKAEKAKDEMKATTKAAKNKTKKSDLVPVKKSLTDLLKEVQEVINSGNAEEIEALQKVMPKTENIQKALPQTTTALQPRRGEY